MKKKFIDVCTLCLITLCIVGIPMFSTLRVYADDDDIPDSNLEGGANNNNGFSEAQTSECPGCAFTIPVDNYDGSYNWYVLGQTGTKFSVTVEVDGETYGVSSDVLTSYDDGFPSPLVYAGGGKLVSNENYQSEIDAYLNDNETGVVVDGHLNASNIIGQLLIEAAEQSGKCTGSDCLTLIETQIKDNADTQGNALEDYFDATYDSMMKICPEHDCPNKFYVSAKEAVNLNGVSNVAIAAADSVEAGTSTSYDDTKKGDYGTGTYDAHDKLDIPTEPKKEITTGGYKKPERKELERPEDIIVPEVVKDELPAFTSNGGNCGENYTESYSEWGDAIDSCGLSHYVITYNTTVIVPTGAGTVFAGQSFSWSGATSTTTIDVTVSEGNELRTSIEKNEVEITNIEQQVNYLKEVADNAVDYLLDLPDCDCTPVSCDEEVQDDQDCEESEGKPCSTHTETIEGCIEETCDWVEECKQDRTDALNEAVAAVEEYNQYVEENSQLLSDLNDYHDELQVCAAEYNEVKDNINMNYEQNMASASNPTLSLGGEVQNSGSIVSVDKGTGIGNTTSNNNSIDINSGNFFIPSNTSTGTVGILSQSVTMPSGFVLEIVCPVDTDNSFISSSNSSTSRGINLIYRSISLTNPFPNNRKTLSSWSDSLVVDSIIYNNRGVSDYDVYNLTPMYDITITPLDIKKIREYNKNHSYNDFTLNCNNGLYCRSTFLTDYIYDNIDINNSCGMDSDWYACDTDSSVSDVKEDLFRYLR